jgi:hypothetical protein
MTPSAAQEGCDGRRHGLFPGSFGSVEKWRVPGVAPARSWSPKLSKNGTSSPSTLFSFLRQTERRKGIAIAVFSSQNTLPLQGAFLIFKNFHYRHCERAEASVAISPIVSGVGNTQMRLPRRSLCPLLAMTIIRTAG